MKVSFLILAATQILAQEYGVYEDRFEDLLQKVKFLKKPKKKWVIQVHDMSTYTRGTKRMKADKPKKKPKPGKESDMEQPSEEEPLDPHKEWL